MNMEFINCTEYQEYLKTTTELNELLERLEQVNSEIAELESN
jgi:hypothetical protein